MIEATNSSGSQPSLLRGLSEEAQVRLTEVLDAYLQQLERNEAPSREALLAAHPELGETLGLYLEKLEDLYRLTGNEQGLGGGLAGKQLGNYCLEREIGRGGMGIVFSATEASLNRHVAVKLLPMAAVLEPKFVERFRNEARAAAQLEHPNIVPVYAVGESAGIHFYAMRLIDGSSLDQRIATYNKHQTRPPTVSTLQQFADVADALHSAHDYGIVHRDIKPSNLLLDDSGKLWVADFGLARFQDGQTLTLTGEMVGTMRYMSPEQAAGDGEIIDHRTDIYSLGVTLYELLSGVAAVPGEAGPNLLRAIATHSPVRLRKLRPDLSRDLQTCLEKAMAFHRDDRYLTAKDFAADLRRVASGQPITAKLVSPMVLGMRWSASHPGVVSVVVAVVAMLGLALSTATYMVNQVIARERDEAVANLIKAHELERVRAQTIDRLALMPGVEEVRRELIPISLRYYQDFAKQRHDGPMKDELARAFSRMGTLHEELGNVADAIANYQGAEDLYRQLVAQQPASGKFSNHRLENLNHLALAVSRGGRGDQAAELLAETVLTMRVDYARSQLPKNLVVEYGLAENNYGFLLQKEGQQSVAQEAYERSISTLEEVQAEFPDDQEATRGLGAAYHNLGSLFASESAAPDLQRAEELYDRALATQLAIARQAHNRLRASIDLVTTYISLGNLYLGQQKLHGAAQAFENAVSIVKRLVDISPQVDAYRRDLAVCLTNLGMSQYQLGDLVDAKQCLKEAVHEYRTLVAKHPDNTGVKSSLGIALNNQGIVLQHLGDVTAAEDAYAHAAGILESTQPLQMAALEKVYVNHIRMLRNAGRDEEASELLHRQTAMLSTERGKL